MNRELIPTSYQFEADFQSQNIRPIKFDRMRSPFYDGEKWAVRRGSECLSIDGKWEYEPMPSNRNDEFYARFRFNSLKQAVETAEANEAP